MRSPLTFLLLLITSFAFSQTVKNNQIIIGSVDSVHSKILNGNRKVWIYVPRSAAAHPDRRYPVVYLLDGDLHFTSVMGMIQQLSEVNANDLLPEMIVVGIPSADRGHDFTPTRALTVQGGRPMPQPNTSGGGEKFEDYLERELMPHIDSIYPAAPYNILIGHSFGGLMVVNDLLNHTNSFSAYLAIDPSMWWNDSYLLKQAAQTLKQPKFSGKSLFLGIANTMPEGMDTTQVRRDTTPTTLHIRDILALKDLIKSNPANGLNFSYRYYGDDSHVSAPFISEYDGLRFLFSYYHLDIAALAMPSPATDPAAIFTAHYQEISKHFGYTVFPPEETVNFIAQHYELQPSLSTKAYDMLAMNIKNYPNSANAYASMGDYMVRVKKDKTKAMDYYQQSLKLKETKATRDKLNKLMADK